MRPPGRSRRHLPVTGQCDNPVALRDMQRLDRQDRHPQAFRVGSHELFICDSCADRRTPERCSECKEQPGAVPEADYRRHGIDPTSTTDPWSPNWTPPESWAIDCAIPNDRNSGNSDHDRNIGPSAELAEAVTYLSKPKVERIQLDGWLNVERGDPVMVPGKDGHVRMGGRTDERHRSGTSVRIWIDPEADPYEAIKLAKSLLKWY